MRLLLSWIAWLALVLYTVMVERTSVQFLVLVAVLTVALAALLVWSIWRLFRAYITTLRADARERRIWIRDSTTESPLERSLARELEAQGVPYVREYRISRTHVDFAFPDAKLAVECDGYRYHHDRRTQDAARDKFLRSQGWRVLRFSGDEIRANPSRCVAVIRKHL
jgi:very-short-patch-repair endonuclease